MKNFFWVLLALGAGLFFAVFTFALLSDCDIFRHAEAQESGRVIRITDTAQTGNLTVFVVTDSENPGRPCYVAQTPSGVAMECR